MSTKSITPAEIRFDLLARNEIAIIDLREEAFYANNHPLFAVSLPYSRLELEILDRVPRKETRIALYDAGEQLAIKAYDRLTTLGYSDVALLEGGLEAWRAAGFELFQDVNSASKAFGELVESKRHTPSLSAPEVKSLIENSLDVVVLDARRFDEYHTMSIPRGISVPGGELVMRARELAPNPSTTIVVNCAGRTRSIIGAQSLINAGLPNRVFALQNGTIGWTLAGLKLEHGQSRRFAEPRADFEKEARKVARKVAYRAGVRRLNGADLAALASDARRTLYRFDVRTPEEYEEGHIAGFRSAPGGQLVQETDVFAPVRGARIVIADDRGVRADMTASWLAQMAWQVYVLDPGFAGDRETGTWKAKIPTLPAVTSISAAQLADRLDSTTLIDLAPSPQYKRGHIPNAWFAIRSQLAAAVGRWHDVDSFVLTSPDGMAAKFAAAELTALSGCPVAALEGGTARWREEGKPLEQGLTRSASDTVDVYRRPYEGTDNAPAAMQAYLDWEYGLVDQLACDGTHGFFVI